MYEKTIRDHTFRLRDGRQLGYSEYGDIKGKPILYFHGWPSSRLQAEVNDNVAEKLHIRIISIDRPGYGLSTHKDNRSLLDWPDDVLELTNNLNIHKFSVMGVSGGGPYAVVCAYKIPERITKVGIVVGLAPTYVSGLIDGMSWLAKIGWANYARYPLLRTLASLFLYENAKYGPSLGLYRFLFGARSDRRIFSDPRIQETATKSFREAFRNGYQGVELDLKLYTNDWGFNLHNIKSKVFLFYGEDDKNVPLSMGRYYATQIPNSKLIVYSDEGHLISRTHIEEILDTLSPPR